ncbi:diguanylate cyclase [Simiduia sp. 21SJ11W-1]|uniref:diguanylate cyclase domain-containing protein n=1 Tax=Simiduia sp. 21SJ11W-1 TaxID=2909669 RepID=UPI00209D31BF|nr:diguanylate cyclase [Simiduia sp. 21SJ11W-1]UTA46816.1 diguanylate cyclase [Simiduia sp. 21SJ11W-1]
MTRTPSQLPVTQRLLQLLLCCACLCVMAEPLGAPVDLEQAAQLVQSQPARVVALLEAGLNEAEQRGGQYQLELWALLTRAYVVQSQLEQASALAVRLHTQASTQGNIRFQAVALREQGAIAHIQTRYPEALSHYQQSLQVLADAALPRERGLTFIATAHAQRALFQYGPALTSARKALGFFREVGATGDMADAFNAIGVILERTGDLEEALAAHLQALEIRRALNRLPGVADSLYNIGEIYRELADFTSAEAYLIESVEIDRSLSNRSNRSNQAYGLYKLADIQCALDKFEQARENGLRALALFRELGAAENVSHVLINLAKLEYRAGNQASALAFIRQARSEMPMDSAPELQGRLDLYYARILLKNGEPARAAEVIQESLAVPELLDTETRLGLYLVKADVFEATGQLAEALATLKAHNRIQAESLTRVRTASLAKVRASVEFMQREQQLQLLSRDKNLQQAQTARAELERTMWVGGALLLVCFMAVVLGRYQLRRANGRLKAELKAKADALGVKELELIAAQDQLAQVAQSDPLTGMANRRFLLAHIEQDCAKSMRDYLNWLQQRAPLPVQSDLVFFLLDLDNFKSVNDHYGHACGDQVLSQMRPVLSQIFRETDYQVRWGGEEFLVVARFSQRENAALLAERLRTLVEGMHFRLEGNQQVQLTLSIGFACFPFYTDRPGHYNWTQVVDIADLCLCAAKRSGRNQWVGMTGVEGLEHEDTFQRLFSEPAQVVREGWVNLYSLSNDPEAIVWQNQELGFKPN